MNWVLTLVLSVAVVEVALRLDFLRPLRKLTLASRGSMRVIGAKNVSDHWKERAMGAYAKRTFAASMSLAGLLLVIAAAAVVLVLGFDAMFPGFMEFQLGVAGLSASLIFALAWVYIRKKLVRG